MNEIRSIPLAEDKPNKNDPALRDHPGVDARVLKPLGHQDCRGALVSFL
jgi:hypothetical protein